MLSSANIPTHRSEDVLSFGSVIHACVTAWETAISLLSEMLWQTSVAFSVFPFQNFPPFLSGFAFTFLPGCQVYLFGLSFSPVTSGVPFLSLPLAPLAWGSRPVRMRRARAGPELVTYNLALKGQLRWQLAAQLTRLPGAG